MKSEEEKNKAKHDQSRDNEEQGGGCSSIFVLKGGMDKKEGEEEEGLCYKEMIHSVSAQL